MNHQKRPASFSSLLSLLNQKNEAPATVHHSLFISTAILRMQ
jgi:hypothetical protein